MSKNRGRLITFEGLDGSGKTTQIRLLSAFLSENKINCTLAREPGGTAAGDRIRDILISSDHKLCRETELLLIEASRAQIVQEVLLPELEKGKWVLLDRYYDATIAYQAFGRGVDIEICNCLNSFTTFGIEPDMTFLLAIDPVEGLRRKKNQFEDMLDRFENESYEFFRKVSEGYDYIMAANRHRVVQICGSDPADKIAQIIKGHILRLIEGKK